MPNFNRPPQEGGEVVVLPEGVYQAKAISIRPGESHEAKTPYVAVDFAIHDPEGTHDQYTIDLKLWDTDRAYDFATARMLELIDADFDTFAAVAQREGLTSYDEILYHYKIKGQWYKLRIQHTPRKDNPDKAWVNIVKVKKIDPPFDPRPKSVPAETPKPAPKGVDLEEEF